MLIRGIFNHSVKRLHRSRPMTRLRNSVRRASRYRGALVVVLWQAPIGPVANPDGSVGFMFGGGLDHLLQFSCDGQVTGAERVQYTVFALEADYDIAPAVRVETSTGFLTSGTDWQDGAFAGAQLRYDATWFGGGAGVVSGRATDEFTDITDNLSAHLRVGPAVGVHARADLNPVHALMPQQFARLGVGWNATRRNRPSGFAGVAILGGDIETAGVAGEITLPVSDRGAARAIGHFGSRDGFHTYGLAVGGRFLIGSARP